MTPLRQRMLDALVLRGMALRTQEAYIDDVARLARHYRRSPETLSADEVQRYLLHLLRERKLARSSVNQYGCAFRFFYGTVLGLPGDTFQIPLAPAPQRLLALDAGVAGRPLGAGQPRPCRVPRTAVMRTSRLMLLTGPHTTCGPRRCCAPRCATHAPKIDDVLTARWQPHFSTELPRTNAARSDTIARSAASAGG